MHLFLKLMATGFVLATALSPGITPARAQWGEVFVADREVAPGLLSTSVDAMVLPDGTPVVGFQTTLQSAAISFIENNAPRQVNLPNLTRFTRVEADRFGIVSYATTFLSVPGFGTDNGSAGAFDTEDRFELSGLINRGAPADLALSQAGVPTIVGRSQFGDSYIVSSFDIPQGAWTAKTIPSFIETQGPAATNTVAKYTDDDRLVIAGVSPFGFELLVEQTDGSFYSINPGVESNELGTSIATAGGEVAFAFGGNSTTTVGILSDYVVAYESIPSDGNIGTGALAYAPDGTLSMAYTHQTTGEITLAQRTAPGTWDAQPTGFNASDNTFLSLAFADDGTPYIGIGDDSFVSMISTAFPIFVLGDMDGSGALTNADIAPFVQALTDPSGYANDFPSLDPNQIGDFNDDGIFTNADISGFVSALVGGGSSITAANLAALSSPIPEPSAFMLLAVGTFTLARRRRQG